MNSIEELNKIKLELYLCRLKDTDSYYNKQQFPNYPKNTFTADKVLTKYLEKILPDEIYKKFYSNLVQYGEKCGTLYPSKSKDCEVFKPVLEKYDASGK